MWASSDSCNNAERHRRHDRWNPFNERLHRVYRLQGELRDAQKAADHAHEIANRHLMVLSGEAGTGKTHLLCDIAKQRVDASAPTVLLMGQRFVSAEAPWPQALQTPRFAGHHGRSICGSSRGGSPGGALCGHLIWPPFWHDGTVTLDRGPVVSALKPANTLSFPKRFEAEPPPRFTVASQTTSTTLLVRSSLTMGLELPSTLSFSRSFEITLSKDCLSWLARRG